MTDVSRQGAFSARVSMLCTGLLLVFTALRPLLDLFLLLGAFAAGSAVIIVAVDSALDEIHG